MDQNALLFQAVQSKIVHDWSVQTLDTQCKQILHSAATSQDYHALDNFWRTVYQRYASAPVVSGHEDQSINYLLLVKDNTGGNAQRQCGPANGQLCP